MGRNRVKSADPFCKDRTRVLAFRTLKSKTGKEYNEAPKEDELDSRGMSKTQQRFSRDLQRQMLLSGKKKHLTHEELKEINDFKKAQREKKEKQERAKVKIHNFETEMREGESLRSFQRRLELEKRRVLIAEAPKLKTLSAKKKAHLNKKKAEKKERERLKREEEELDKRYEPQYETVPFGEVSAVRCYASSRSFERCPQTCCFEPFVCAFTVSVRLHFNILISAHLFCTFAPSPYPYP